MKYILVLYFASLLLTGCTTYKTREFSQTDKVQLESWSIDVNVWAFIGSSNSSWKDNSFRVSVAASTYDGEIYRNTNYKSAIKNFSLYSGMCPGDKPLDLGQLSKREHEHGRKTIRLMEQLWIDQIIENLCAKITLELSSSSGDIKEMAAYQIELKRNETSSVGIILD